MRWFSPWKRYPTVQVDVPDNPFEHCVGHSLEWIHHIMPVRLWLESIAVYYTDEPCIIYI